MPPFNGVGTYTLTAGQPVVAGTDILDSTFNLLTADLATALSTCVTRDGQSPPTANLPMGSFKLTGLSAGTAAGHSVRFEQLQTGTNKLITVAGTGDVITGVMTPTYTAYTNGDMFTFVVGSSNTTNVTINIDGLGAKAITNGTTALTAGALIASRVVVIQYDGTGFQLLNFGTLPVANGGTNITTYTTGDILYASGTNVLSKLAAGSNTNVLTLAAGVPTWAASASAGVTTFNGSTTGLTPATATSGAITLGGTLAVANGGTGVTTSTGTGAVVLGTSPTLITPTFNSAQLATVSGTAPLYMCRAWVNFNGTGTVAINASGNVSSITDNGVGDYTVNFTTAMSDINYSTVISYSQDYGVARCVGAQLYHNSTSGTEQAPTTTTARFGTTGAAAAFDAKYACVSIFR